MHCRFVCCRARRSGRLWAVPNLDVVLKTMSGEATARTDQDGAAVFPAGGSPKSVMIQVQVYNLKRRAVSPEPAHNDFVFEINVEAVTTVPFRGEVLKVKGDALELLYWDKSQPMVYKKE